MNKRTQIKIAEHFAAIAKLLMEGEPLPEEPRRSDFSYLMDDVDLEYWLDQYGEESMPSYAMCASGNGKIKEKEERTWMTNYLREEMHGVTVRDTHVFLCEGRGYYKPAQQYFTMFRCSPVN